MRPGLDGGDDKFLVVSWRESELAGIGSGHVMD